MTSLLIGADPELFFKRRGEFIAAGALIPGTKKAPHKVFDGAVQVDGLAAEFNIEPAVDERQFLHHIDSVMGQLRRMVPREYELSITATAHFDPEYMSKQPDEAKQLGCDPDFNAYNGQVNPRPMQHATMRTAAGHIHLGWTAGRDVMDPRHYASCCVMVKQLDFYLGLPSVILDKDTQRKEMYGKAGAFRPKPYGLEYRVLSNFWLLTPKLKQWAYRNTKAGFEKLATEGVELAKQYGNICSEIINTNNVAEAERLCKELNITVG